MSLLNVSLNSVDLNEAPRILEYVLCNGVQCTYFSHVSHFYGIFWHGQRASHTHIRIPIEESININHCMKALKVTYHENLTFPGFNAIRVPTPWLTSNSRTFRGLSRFSTLKIKDLMWGHISSESKITSCDHEIHSYSFHMTNTTAKKHLILAIGQRSDILFVFCIKLKNIRYCILK